MDEILQLEAAEARRLLLERYGSPPAAYVHSYGCQQNVSDGERLSGLLESCGCRLAEDLRDADLILLNTCAVRKNAENRVYGNLGALSGLKKKRPELLIAVCGCMAQRPETAAKIRQSYPQVDLLFGANQMARLPGLLAETLRKGGRVLDGQPAGGQFVEDLPVRRQGKFRAWLPVMQGCDNFCAYCIVPYVRGRERSREEEDILREARALIADGAKELTLLGQNVNSYGKGLRTPSDFPKLLRRLNDLEGDFRIRFMTSHPKDCTEALIGAVADCDKVCKHIHLPVQSGSDRILQAMNRRYTAGHYRKLLELARERIPGVQFTTDILLGFPGETEEDFQQTLELVRDARFTSMFTFLYSPREGTAAEKFPEPVPEEVKSRRIQQLLAVQEPIGCAYYQAEVGQVRRVLAEGPAKSGVPGCLTGKTDTGIIVEFPGDPDCVGQFVDVKIARALNWAVTGNPINQTGI